MQKVWRILGKLAVVCAATLAVSVAVGIAVVVVDVYLAGHGIPAPTFSVVYRPYVALDWRDFTLLGSAGFTAVVSSLVVFRRF